MKSRKLQYTKLLILLGVVFLAAPLFSQVETYGDCFTKKSNADLKNLSKKQKGEFVDGRFYSIGVNSPDGGMDWQTSFFRDRPPRFVVSKTKPKNQTQNEWAEDTCRFNSYKVHDGQEATYWCEGVPGVGIGEVVMGLADIKDKNYFYILSGANGLRKNFESYSRPLDIDIHYLVPMEVGTTQSGGKVFSEVLYWSKQSVKLSKDPGYQKIEIQPYKEIMKSIQGNRNIDYPLILVAIEIKSVIEGKENKEHTCISEIGNSSWSPEKYTKPTLRD